MSNFFFLEKPTKGYTKRNLLTSIHQQIFEKDLEERNAASANKSKEEIFQAHTTLGNMQQWS